MKRNRFGVLLLSAIWLWNAGLTLVASHAWAGQPENPNAGTNAMLRVAGLQIVDGASHPVRLRGVNLGGWLDWEGWMFGEGFLSETEILNKLGALAGLDAAQAFQLGIYSNYVAEADFRKIAELGFNSVRVPINYRLLDISTNHSVAQEAGWRVLDQTLDWCDQFHLYAVLDLHAAPGGQSKLFMADPDAKQSLWQSADDQRRTAALWRAIAARYKSRSCIAGYDLLNEPAPASGQQWAELCRQLVEAIRAEDKQHILFIEGGSLAADFSMFAQPPDTNMTYSFHIYTWFGDNRGGKLADYIKFARQQNVPLWAGEFGENNYEMIGSTVKMFESSPEICGWAFWPWKRAPSLSPGLVTVKIPADWRKVMAWIDHPLLHQKPDAKETTEAMAAFLEAVKFENTQLDEQMLQELLPATR